MLLFSYDGSFEGLLCAVYDAYTLRLFPDALCAPKHGQGPNFLMLASRTHTVATDPSHAGRVERALQKKLSADGMRRVHHAWLADTPTSAMALFQYIRLVFDNCRPVDADLSHPVIFALHKLARSVSKETQHLLGFVRFQKTAEAVYAATIAPQHDVLPLLLRHFSARFAEQNWLVYDVYRDYGVLRDAGGFHDVFLDAASAAQLKKDNGRLPAKGLAAEEALVQNLWKTYFAAVAIQERKNPGLQARCMPRRYWRFMTEKQI